MAGLKLVEENTCTRKLARHLEAVADAILDGSKDVSGEPAKADLARHVIRLILQLNEELPLSLWTRAEALSRCIRAVSPHDKEALLAQIEIANGLKQPKRALQYAQDASRLFPEDETVLRRLARAAWKAKNLSAAHEAMRSCNTVRPGDYGLWITLARAWRDEGDLASAVTALHSLLDARPCHRAGRELLVETLLRQGEAEAALAHVRRWQADEPEEARPLLLLAIALAETGHATAALDALAAVFQLPKLSLRQVQPSCEWLAAGVGREAAVTVWRMTAAYFPKKRIAWMRLSDAVMEQAGIEAAIQALREGQRHLADDHALSLKVARLFVRARRLPEAKKELDTTLALQPGNSLVLEVYGKLVLDMGETAQADRVFKDLLSREPDNQNAILGRVEVAAGRGDTMVAFQILEDVLLQDE
ncbi:MAG: tetratricopeptide repeat protein [Pseudomonadota bacterium]